MGKILEGIATGLFVGKVKYFPGTLGSLWAIPFILLARDLFSFAIIFLFLFVFGVISADFVAKKRGEKDPREVVIDEIVGFFVSTFNLEPNFKNLALAFILFRLFDILKPFPIREVENFGGGLGIVLDDVVAGAYVCVVLWILKVYVSLYI
ncbi:MAG: phosphatidylglycerophosphatase A [Candidatus Caldipriscus sp.]